MSSRTFSGTRAIGRQKVQQAAMIVLVLLGDLLAPRVARLRPFPARAGQVAAERRRVEVPLVVRQRVVLREPAQVHVVADRLAGGDEPRDELVALRIVVRRRRDRQAVVGSSSGRAGSNTPARRAPARRACRVRRLAPAASRPLVGIAGHDVRIERKIAVPHALAAGHAAVRRRASGDSCRGWYFSV